MNKNDLIFELNSFKTAERVNRDKSAKFILNYPETFPFLIELIFEDQKRINIKAAWVLELVCFDNISIMAAYLDYFSQNLINIKNESALRPISKVCSFISNAHYAIKNNQIHLTKNNMLLFIESNFDWLIEEHKVACKVFAMDTLYVLGSEFDWVHEELRLILEKNRINGSAGYQSRAKKVLKQLNS